MKYCVYLFLVFLCGRSFVANGQVVVEGKKEANKVLFPCTINGYDTKSFVDTGSSCISISKSLYNILLNSGNVSTNNVIKKKRSQENEAKCNIGEMILINKLVIGGLVLKNVNAIIGPHQDVPISIPLQEISQLGEAYLNDSIMMIFSSHNSNRINAIQRFTYSIFKNKTDKALNLIIKKHDYDKATLLLNKVNEKQKSRMSISYNLASAIISIVSCNDSSITSCNYLTLKELFNSLKEKYAEIGTRDLFTYQKNNVYDNEKVDYYWIINKSKSYDKYYSQRVFEMIINENITDCRLISSLIKNATLNKEYDLIPVVYETCRVLFMEYCDSGYSDVCSKLNVLNSIISTASLEDMRIFKENDITVSELVKGKIDSLCTRKTVLAIRELGTADKKNKYFTVLHMLREARKGNDSLDITKTYLSTWAKYYELIEDTLNYCFYYQLAKSMTSISQEDSCIWNSYSKIINNTKECDKHYIVKKADVCYLDMKRFIENTRRMKVNIDKIMINGEPVRSEIVRLSTTESIIITEFPLWASSDNDIGVYKNKIIDQAYDNYCRDIFELINTHKTSSTNVTMIVLGKADSHPIGNRVYDEKVENNDTLFIKCSNVVDTCVINDTTFFFYEWDYYNDTIVFGKGINDYDLAYLRAANFVSRYKAINKSNLKTQFKLYIYDCPDAMSNYSKHYRQVTIYIIISYLVFTAEEKDEYEKSTMLKICLENNEDLKDLLKNNPVKNSATNGDNFKTPKKYKFE